MKKWCYAGALLLALFEIANVYFLPGCGVLMLLDLSAAWRPRAWQK